LTQQNLSVKRPGEGISPMKWDDVVGTKSAKDYNEDEPI
jgi:N,N'-diacetyllegionaminate synthase